MLFVSLSICSLCIAAEGPAKAGEPIKIGSVLSVTGWGGFLGAPERDALIAIVEDANRKGGLLGRQIELTIEDDQSNPSTAAVAATKLVRDKRVAVVVGPTITDSGLAMIPVCEQAQTPLVTTAPILNPAKKWVFLTGPGDPRGASRILEFAIKELGMKRIALLHDSAAYGMTAAKIYNKDIADYPGAAIVIDERYETTDTNMVSQLMKIKAANPDIIILHGTGNLAAVIAKNYKQLGLTIPVLASHATVVPAFVKLAGPIAEENKWMFFSIKHSIVKYLPPDDPYRKNLFEPFERLMKEKYGDSVKINQFHVSIYDGIKVAMEAIRTAGTDDRAAIRDALEKIRVDCFLGPYEATPEDHQGSRKDYYSVPMMLNNGEFVPFRK